MLDPFNLTNFNRTRYELEELCVFAVCVSGKRADVISKKVEEFLKLSEGNTPFDRIRKMIRKDMLLENLQKVKMGNYTALLKCFRKLINIGEITLEKLEQIHKIKLKTSRMIIVHSQRNSNHAVLDVHILSYMREKFGIKETATPAKKRYLELEKIFLDHCHRLGREVADLDLEIWKKYTKSKKI